MNVQSCHVCVCGHQRVSVGGIWCFWDACAALGTVLFSGSLYCLALSHMKFWVFVTPVGGLCFLIGWFLMLIGALRLKLKADRHE